MAFSVALQVYSVRDYAEKDLKGTLQKIKEVGYDGVEFAGLYGHTVAEVKSMVEEIGLNPISAHVPLDEMLSDPNKVIAGYAEIGCKYIAVPHLDVDRRPGTEMFMQTIKDIEGLGETAKKHGIQLLYHNHDFEFKKINGEYALDVLYQTVPSDLLQTQIDTCWVNIAGEDPADYVRKYSGRAPVVHLKDFVMSGKEKPEQMYVLLGTDSEKAVEQEEETFGFRPIGYGVQNFPAILTASEEAGAEWLVVEQDRPSMGKTAMECAELSRKYLNSLGV
ncbi:MAG TPA: sugar phosphate isomerase/epimerase [Clostridiales bacterium]|mgnify:FL=1|nr:sugar phosphate isomerase/epimerase [Clostridia bacterium]HCS75804.1 sugar phosphate isomerase/epimerase [Clostridiales bacterium]